MKRDEKLGESLESWKKERDPRPLIGQGPT